MYLVCRTASELKVQKAQGDAVSTVALTDTSRGFATGIGIDMSSGAVDEAADRALSSVARKLNKALSVEYTVNELIADATDLTNLATIFYGKHLFIFQSVAEHLARLEPTLLMVGIPLTIFDLSNERHVRLRNRYTDTKSRESNAVFLLREASYRPMFCSRVTAQAERRDVTADKRTCHYYIR